MNKKIEEINNRLQSDYDLLVAQGYEVLGVFLQGSQNYNLQNENSDIDTKAIVLPSLDDIILNKDPISYTRILDTPKREHIDIKDIRAMFSCFKKQNINFVEILFTDHSIINPEYTDLFHPMLYHNERIARYNNYASVSCVCGMIMEKYKALEHPYPSTLETIQKYMYDPKQLHHIVRCTEFLERYVKGETYQNCLISNHVEYLMRIKNGQYNLEEARDIAKANLTLAKEIKDEYIKSNPLQVDREVERIMNQTVVSIIKHHLRKQINKIIDTDC